MSGVMDYRDEGGSGKSMQVACHDDDIYTVQSKIFGNFKL